MEFGDLPLLAAHVATEEPKVVASMTGGPTSGNKKQGGRDSNPRPLVLETSALPD